jgi:hypothetical protein
MVKRLLRRLILWALTELPNAAPQPQAPAGQILNEWLHGPAVQTPGE